MSVDRGAKNGSTRRRAKHSMTAGIQRAAPPEERRTVATLNAALRLWEANNRYSGAHSASTRNPDSGS
jgi:hypothetical protein